MLSTTLPVIRCLCGGPLALRSAKEGPGDEIRSGELGCKECKAVFLILGGVALLVEDVHEYLMTHVKGISRVVQDEEIPKELRRDFREAKAELKDAPLEHFEEDLEAERVNALYFMNHYLRADEAWRPQEGTGSPVIEELIRQHWDNGPFAQIGRWAMKMAETDRPRRVVELGCGVGGLARILQPHCEFYLGVDSSFAGIALARHVAYGAPYPHPIRIPEDLLQGPLSREIRVPAERGAGGVDFVVADLANAPLAPGEWDLAIALNSIDMLEDPMDQPRLQHKLLRQGGVAIQSCPYIWHERAAKKLRARLPSEITDSARAAEWLYGKAGFEITDVIEHLPWLFFKHRRQLEVYSVHMMMAKRSRSRT